VTLRDQNRSGGRHAPNHPADRFRGTSRHHYLDGGLDEQPTLKLIPRSERKSVLPTLACDGGVDSDVRDEGTSGPLVAAHSRQRINTCLLYLLRT
jgi:hypothetical protein